MVREGTYTHHGKEGIQKMKIQTIGNYAELLRREGLLINHISTEKEAGEITQISCYSGEIREGAMFLCKGAAFRETYLSEAILRGAKCYVSEKEYPAGKGIPCLLVSDIRRAMAALAEAFYGYPADQMRIVGITGTKGKTTTAYYVRAVLDTWLARRGEKPSAIFSSIETYDGVRREPAKLTTPESLDLQRHLRTAVDVGVSWLTMEVSSQAMKLQRIGNVRMETGVFLNISRDHISPLEHSDFEEYFQSKLQMFSHCRNVCVNLDSDYAARILRAASGAEQVIAFGTSAEAAVRGSHIRTENRQLRFHLSMPGYEGEIRIPMRGTFNAENALAAISVCFSLGIPADCIVEGLSNVRVRGRMEEYRSRDGKRTVLVDYAHNRLSFEKLFASVREEYPGRPVTVIFGCPGGKAYNRRKDLAEVSDRYADSIYLVPDDPGPEEPEKIAGEIMSHIHGKKRVCTYVGNRQEAVRRAVEEAPEDAVVLVLGKGCEATQKYADGIRSCTPDSESVRVSLAEYDRKCETNALPFKHLAVSLV